MINWHDGSQKISHYFTSAEVTKGDPRRIPLCGGPCEKEILALAIELDRIRSDWGKPILVTSWFRPPLVNRAVGGVRDSQHLYGRAVDIKPLMPKDLPRFQSWLDTHWYGALGYGARILGACETIKALLPDVTNRRFLLKQIFPYLIQDKVNYWGQFYGLT